MLYTEILLAVLTEDIAVFAGSDVMYKSSVISTNCNQEKSGSQTLPMYPIVFSSGDGGTYVINKQTPNRQIWLSSPIRYSQSESQSESQNFN